MEKEKLILKFLQENTLDLYKTNATLLDVKYADNPPRVVLTYPTAPKKVPVLKYENTVIDVEVEIQAKQKAVVMNEETLKIEAVEPENDMPKVIDVTEKKASTEPTESPATETTDLTPDQLKHLGITETTDIFNPKAKNLTALEQWKKRHKAVKKFG